MERNMVVTVVIGRFGSVVDRGLLHILRDDPDLRVVGANLGHAALELAVAQRAPHVAIVNEGSLAAPAVVRRLRAARPGIGLLVFGHDVPSASAAGLLATGISSRLSLDASVPEILGAVRFVAGNAYSNGASSGWRWDSLTSRERTVARLLSAGQKNAEIAVALRVSTETVKTHTKHIYRKLGISSRWELFGIELPLR